MIVAGIGARAAVTANEIVAAVTDACGRAGIAVAEVGLLAGLDRRETIASLREAGLTLTIGTETFDTARLQQESPRCVTHSERSLSATGVPSVAEAAALAGAGLEGMLLLPRVAFPTVTVALAIGPGGTDL